MTTDQIIAELDAEITRLKRVRTLLSAGAIEKTVTAAVPKRRKMSAAARKKIATAQKARWAKQKAGK